MWWCGLHGSYPQYGVVVPTSVPLATGPALCSTAWHVRGCWDKATLLNRWSDVVFVYFRYCIKWDLENDCIMENAFKSILLTSVMLMSKTSIFHSYFLDVFLVFQLDDNLPDI